jgi:hypothetical protein
MKRLRAAGIGRDEIFVGAERRCDVVETILYDKRDRIAFVTLNRPEAKNAIDLYDKTDAGRAGASPTAL